MSLYGEILPNIKELYQWEENLSATERSILEVAYKLYVVQQAAGTCYNSAFFLCYYLKKHYDIDGYVEVGFINDGVHERTPSHAWYVHKGRITDVSISRPLNPHLIRPGPLTILGRDLIAGWKWNYYPAQSENGIKALGRLLTTPSDNPEDVTSLAKQIHIRMSKIAKSKSMMRACLDRCPPGMTYRDLVEAIRHLPLEQEREETVHEVIGFNHAERPASQTRFEDAFSS
ncbi:MAG: hypothetical protein K2X09_02775 [Rickettsiales bacterium]|nr:hypothetical protein [Rickettsiales bacterium]